jgi:ABC-2 type transport system permease protein
MSKLNLIIKREYNAKVRNKSFIVMTILAPFLMVGMGLLIFYLSKANDSKIKTIAYVDEANLLTKEAFKDTDLVHYINLTNLGEKEAKAEADKNEYYGLLTIPKQDSLELLAKNIHFYSKKSPNMMMVESLEKKIEHNIRNQKLQRLGIDVAKINSAKINASLKLSNFSGETTSKMINGFKIAIGSFAGYMIMMFIIVFGNSVMRSVIEEKTSRIIEVIISSIKPFQLMMGKIIGNALAGLTQFAIWGILIAILSFVVSIVFGVSFTEMQTAKVSPEQMEMAKEIMGSDKMQNMINEIMQLPLLSMTIYFILYFLGGYLLYSSLYAAIGAAVDSETDTQQFMMPVMMPLMLGVYVGFASVMNDPHGPVAVIFSIIPLTSPIVMLMRIPFGVPPIQIAISLILLIVTFLLIVWMAAKIYRVGVLMYGKKPTYKELYKWLKY